MNWAKYVSNAVGYMEHTHSIYTELFRSKKGNGIFNNISDRASPFYNFHESQVQQAAVAIKRDIDAYFQDHPYGWTDIQSFTDVISYSPSHFLNRDINWDRPDGYHLSVLAGLFGVAENPRSLFSGFYEDWNTTFEEEKRRIRRTLQKQDVEDEFKKSLSQYFKAWEDIIKNTLTQIEDNVQTEDSDPLDPVKDFYHRTKSFTDDYKKLFKKYTEILNEEHIFDDDSSVNDKQAHPLTRTLKKHFRTIDVELEQISEDISPSNVTEYDKDQYVSDFYIYLIETWYPWVQLEEQGQLHTLLDDHFFNRFVEYMARNLIKQRVLAAGLQYLNKIIEIKTRTRRFDSFNIGMTRQREREGLVVPNPALPVFYKLGPDNIFVRLYARTFVNLNLSEEKSHSHQIKPHTPGMSEVEKLNHLLQSHHPTSLQRLYTPYITDFVIASALCGPDLDLKEDPNLLQQIQNIVSTENPQEAFETAFEEYSLDDIVNLLPVFDHRSSNLVHLFFGNGLSYAFHPPRITRLQNEHEREAICNGFTYDLNNPAQYYGNVFEGRFQVEGKTYDNILLLVLDFLEAAGLSSEEEFNRWWEEKVKPYYSLFMMAMDREYKYIARYAIKPLFQDGVKTININTNLNDEKFLSESKQRALDEIERRGDFSAVGLIDEYSETFPFHLPKGFFHNMYFELNYLFDIILHFKSISSNDFNKAQLTYNLKTFAEKFKPDSACTDETTPFKK